MKRLLFISFLALSGCSSPVFHAQCAGQKAAIGMTRDELLKACGVPDTINVDDGPWGKDEQFVYATVRDYVYVKNGRVTAVQY